MTPATDQPLPFETTLTELIGDLAAGQDMTEDDCIEALLLSWDEAVDGLPSVAPGGFHIAPGECCDEVGLPAGSFWVEVLASVMDQSTWFTGTERLRMLRESLKAFGHIS